MKGPRRQAPRRIPKCAILPGDSVQFEVGDDTLAHDGQLHGCSRPYATDRCATGQRGPQEKRATALLQTRQHGVVSLSPV